MAGTKEATILDEIASSLLASGIQLQLYHAEAGPGQYEVVTGPLPPLEAADALIHTREIIYQTASKHGLRATFAPRPFMFSTGSSCHTHISIHSSADSKKSPEGLSTYEAAFLSGVLNHLPSIACITLPTAASYKRMVDGAWSGGTYVSWGTENRESPVRLANASSPSSRNFEVRCVDATANPHLALAAIIGSALAALKKKQPLSIKDCPGPKSAAQLSDDERKALGIEKRMPMNIGEARENFKKDEVLGNVFGKEFMEKYIAVNEVSGFEFH
jgi:glutamine synthetase